MVEETNLATMRIRTGEFFERVMKKLGDKVNRVTMEERFQFSNSGDPLNRVFALKSGKVKLTRLSTLGRDHLLEILGPGDVFGLEALVGENVWFYTATSMESVEVTWAHVEDMRQVLADNHNLEMQLLRSFAALTQQRYERTMTIWDLDVPGRLAAVLLYLGERFGETSEGGLVLPRGLTQRELSQMIGASRETANKILADFCNRAWITHENRLITIIDWERLNRRAS
ncbi:cyclic nucleotide-binding domain protein [Mobiluncus mulieris FB024-16]|uniref:Crp/Fnr family transcriptional regulator n=1 Tax=Mobiluncus mulieris TaxID=2052 RepID=UPI0001E50F57|nr:Crp/Fnr family transcriptional regulator [Mobiluncus mulieris]EFN94235.1 cyclic nucleotide-binding domain protein [Mobiluncus mulieris FB024-16]